MECRCLWSTFKVDRLQIPTRVTLARRIESESIVAEQKFVVGGPEYTQWPGAIVATFPQRCKIAVALEPCVIEDGELGGGRPVKEHQTLSRSWKTVTLTELNP